MRPLSANSLSFLTQRSSASALYAKQISIVRGTLDISLSLSSSKTHHDCIATDCLTIATLETKTITRRLSIKFGFITPKAMREHLSQWYQKNFLEHDMAASPKEVSLEIVDVLGMIASL